MKDVKDNNNYCDYNKVKELLKYADLNATNGEGCTAIMLAV